MKRLTIAALLGCLLSAAASPAQEDVLGLYFSGTEFTAETAAITVPPGFVIAGYIVLTNPTRDTIVGYEVGISCTAEDFAIPATSLTFDTNEGTNLNQIVTFMTPVPVVATGTVLATVFISTDSIDPETISFGAASPSSVSGDVPAIDYSVGPPVACSLPFGSPVVAWLNTEAVETESASWSAVKTLYR